MSANVGGLFRNTALDAVSLWNCGEFRSLMVRRDSALQRNDGTFP